MSLPNIGLIGKAGAGKNSVADRLQSAHAYTQIAFADPLREMARSIDPVIGYDLGEFGGQQSIRLDTLIENVGWDRAKREFSEVRRFLQTLGASVRENDESYWLNIAIKKIYAASNWKMPVVVTDVRHSNEAEWLVRRGFKIVRVSRPGTALSGDAAKHPSETELDGFRADAEIWNGGSRHDLDREVDIMFASL